MSCKQDKKGCKQAGRPVNKTRRPVNRTARLPDHGFSQILKIFGGFSGDDHARTRTLVFGLAGKRLLPRPPRQSGPKSDLLSHSMPASRLWPGPYLTSRRTIYDTNRVIYDTPGFKVLRGILKCWKASSGTPPTLTNSRKRPLRLRGIVSSGVLANLSE